MNGELPRPSVIQWEAAQRRTFPSAGRWSPFPRRSGLRERAGSSPRTSGSRQRASAWRELSASGRRPARVAAARLSRTDAPDLAPNDHAPVVSATLTGLTHLTVLTYREGCHHGDWGGAVKRRETLPRQTSPAGR